MKGSKIVSAAEPRGRFKEGIVSGTPLPGTFMQLTNAAPQAGRFTYAAAPANAVNVAILLEDDLQGFGVGTAYTSGARCRLYVPAGGEEVNCLLATGVTPAVGALIAVGASGIGVAAATNPPVVECLENLAALGANTLVLCEATANLG